MVTHAKGFDRAGDAGGHPSNLWKVGPDVSTANSGAQRRTFAEIGSFLERHRLDVTPANYALVYWVITESRPEAVAAVEKVTGDGLRLTQEDADRILSAVGEVPPGGGIAVRAEVEAVRSQMENFERLVDETRANTESYGRDLESQADALSAASRPDVALAELVRLTGTMIERTRAAEQALQAATGEAQTLRANLDHAREEANRDALTHLPNRRAFETYFAELEAAGRPIAVAICDIDHFKTINDSHGHVVGDRVLRAVAEMMREKCDGHMVARLGGEEFVMVFDGLSLDEAHVVVEHAREAVAARKFRVRETDKPIGSLSFSAGLTACGPGESRETALGRADTLLYQAKNAGRNRVAAA